MTRVHFAAVERAFAIAYAMDMRRSVLSLVLSFLLVITSNTVAVAASGERAVDHMVICIGLETSVVYVDANGNPAHAPHHCPECALHMLGATATAVSKPDTVRRKLHRAGLNPFAVRGMPVFGQNQARAPPFAI